jgi:Silencing defective 2 N-terminal ubiquitin domain
MVNVIVSGIPVESPTRCFQVVGTGALSGGTVLEWVYEQTRLPLSSLMLLVQGRCVGGDRVVAFCDDDTVFVEVRLCCALPGGKGGFGANLRGANASKKTTNFGACRDLSGRRLRDVEREQLASESTAQASMNVDITNDAADARVLQSIAPDVRKSINDAESLDADILEDIEACSKEVENAVAEGLHAARALRKKRAKAKKGSKKLLRKEDEVSKKRGKV